MSICLICLETKLDTWSICSRECKCSAHCCLDCIEKFIISNLEIKDISQINLKLKCLICKGNIYDVDITRIVLLFSNKYNTTVYSQILKELYEKKNIIERNTIDTQNKIYYWNGHWTEIYEYEHEHEHNYSTTIGDFNSEELNEIEMAHNYIFMYVKNLLKKCCFIV